MADKGCLPGTSRLSLDSKDWLSGHESSKCEEDDQSTLTDMERLMQSLKVGMRASPAGQTADRLEALLHEVERTKTAREVSSLAQSGNSLFLDMLDS